MLCGLLVLYPHGYRPVLRVLAAVLQQIFCEKMKGSGREEVILSETIMEILGCAFRGPNPVFRVSAPIFRAVHKKKI
jgi:hypothetical protein